MRLNEKNAYLNIKLSAISFLFLDWGDKLIDHSTDNSKMHGNKAIPLFTRTCE